MPKVIPNETLIELRRKLSLLPARSFERRTLVLETADMYGVSKDTVYRSLRERPILKSAHRSDYESPRILPKPSMEKFCEIVAAIKLKTTNKKGRHLSTGEAISLLENYGVQLSEGLVKAPPGVLKRSTVDRYLKQWGYSTNSLSQAPPAVRFQAERSNDCWQFDLSPSDLKHLTSPEWIDSNQRKPLLMIYSVVDDRSGVSYQEYHNVYGEDVEAALRFLFNAMSKKAEPKFPFQGIPKMIYMDNGPIAKSRIFRRVMDYLGVTVRTHVPQRRDGRRTTARSKGKVERPFRTIKELHETLYHFNQPSSEKEANEWLFNFLIRYGGMAHRSERHTRIEDWMKNQPKDGIKEMCTWERFCAFAREPERRKVGIDTRIAVDGVSYEVDPDLTGQEVVLWLGMFDRELYVEYRDEKYGPYSPVGGVIPLHKFRSYKKNENGKTNRSYRGNCTYSGITENRTGAQCPASLFTHI